MKKLYLVLFVLLFAGLTTAAFTDDSAQPRSQGFQMHHGFEMHHGFHGFGPHFNMTQDQKDRMKAIRDRFQADTHDLKYDIEIKKLEVRKLFTDPKTDDETLLAREKELNGLKLKLMDRKAEMKVEWRKVLTPEQVRMLDRMISFHHGCGRPHLHMHHFHHPGGHMGMGKGVQKEPAPKQDH